MTIAQALAILNALIKLSGTVIGMIKRVGTIITNAQAEGRDLTEAEVRSVMKIDDSARAALVEAIENAKNNQ